MINNNDIKIIKETIKERQELLITCAVLQDELRKQIVAAKKMLEQKKLNNSITVRLHGVYQFNNGEIGYCYSVNLNIARLFIHDSYRIVVTNLDGTIRGFDSRDEFYPCSDSKWNIRRTYKKKYDKEKENGHE